MRKLLLLNIAFLIFNSELFSQSPDWIWAKGIGGTYDDSGLSIAFDASGSVYSTGIFGSTVDFDPGPGTFNLTAAGFWDIFISKLDGSGNFVWAKQMGGTGYEGGLSIAIDSTGSGDVYSTGYFSGTVDFDPDSSGTFYLTAPGGYSHIFISKLDSAGNFIWAKAMDGTIGSGMSYSIALDPAGSGGVYTTGSFTGTVDFDPGAGVFILTGGGMFISKLDSSGNFVWAKSMSGTIGYSIAIDLSGSRDVYTTGKFNGTVDFDPDSLGTFYLTRSHDIFISKLDSSGNFVWAKAIGGASDDRGFSIAIDPAGSGDVYTTGWFNSTADFNPDSLGTFNLTAAGIPPDIFISKLDSAGNFLWAKQMGGTDSDYGISMMIDPAGSGDVYTAGVFSGAADFDPDSSVNFNLTSAGNYDIFISKLDGLGNFVWAKAIGGTNNDRVSSIAFDASGIGHVAGDFESPSISFGSTTLSNASPGLRDIFIAKLDTTIITGNNEIEKLSNVILLFPNPATNHLTIALGNSFKKVEVNITDITGKIIYKTTATETQKIEVNTKDFAEGIYLVKIQSENISETRKLIITK